MRRTEGKRGFTLLELLIVVIIVSILASVALPRFTKMTRRARSSEAASMVGSILTAESLYYQENDVFGPKASLLVDLNETHFTYTVTPSGSTNATVAAVGQGTSFSGISVDGTIDNTGSRTITTTGI